MWDGRDVALSPAGDARFKKRDVALSMRDHLDARKPLIDVARAQIRSAYVESVFTASRVYAVLNRSAGLTAGRIAEAPGFAVGAEIDLVPGANWLIRPGSILGRGLDRGDRPSTKSQKRKS